MNIKVKTGGKAPESGQYMYGSGRKRLEITLSEGERVPPTKLGATEFTLIDKTVHKGGK